MNKPALLIACLLAFLICRSQTKMVIDRIQCTSSFTNVFDYLNYPEPKGKVYSAIKENAAALWNAHLYESEVYTEYDLKRKVGGTIANRKLQTNIVQPTVDGLHLFIGINENPVMVSSENRKDSLLHSLLAHGYCIIDFQAIIVDNSGNIRLNRKSNFIIQNKNPMSYGYVNNDYSISPSSMVELTKQATRILLDTTTELLDFYAVSCTRAYFTDNFIMASTAGRKRILIEEKKYFVSFRVNDSLQNMLRFLDMNLYLMDLKKKKSEVPTIQEQAAIEHRKSHAKNFKYCNMVQEYRNVLGNKNYTSNIAVSLDENDIQTVMDFLPGDVHYMLSGKDTVATFSIDTETKNNDKKVQLNKLYNGIDTSLQTNINSFNSERTIAYNLNIKGKMMDKAFKVLFSNGFALKEIFYNGQLVCIAKGENLPESFVLIDANLPKHILHPLLMLAFIKL